LRFHQEHTSLLQFIGTFVSNPTFVVGTRIAAGIVTASDKQAGNRKHHGDISRKRKTF
jgi:hypothetical protein